MKVRALLLAFAMLFSMLFVASLEVRAGVESISVSMDRQEYVRGMTATARATVVYNGSFLALDKVRFTWFYPNGSIQKVEYKSLEQETSSIGLAYSSAYLEAAGSDFRVEASINSTGGLTRSASISFQVFSGTVMVIVTDIKVQINKDVVEPGTVARAQAMLTYVGNASLLDDVVFEWYRPNQEKILTDTYFKAKEGVALSEWVANGEGTGFVVKATYMGTDRVSNSTRFDVGAATSSSSPGANYGTMVLFLFITVLLALFVALRHVTKRRKELYAKEIKHDGGRLEKPLELEPGEAYLVTQGGDKALGIFTEELKKGNRGMCITRTHPEKLKASWDLKDATMFWLTNGSSNARTELSGLEDLSNKVSRFLSSKKSGVVLLDGVEYLIVHNNFAEVMKFLERIKDMLPENQAKLIIPVDLHALMEHQRALLTREFKIV